MSYKNKFTIVLDDNYSLTLENCAQKYDLRKGTLLRMIIEKNLRDFCFGKGMFRKKLPPVKKKNQYE